MTDPIDDVFAYWERKQLQRDARMAKSVDAPDLKSDALGHAGSSPAARTTIFEKDLRHGYWGYQNPGAVRIAYINEILYGWMGSR